MAGKAYASGVEQYQKLVAELRAQAIGAAVATEQIEIAFVADFELSQRFGTDTQATMMARANVLDGIFDSQVGVTIVPFFQIFTDSNDPFTASNASTLLNELSTYRRNTPNIRSRGLAHLMTGRALDGNTAGVAFIGALCSVGSGAGLSEGTGSNTVASLIAAHEIGHNFGAPHDAEAGSACASTPGTFLMNPQINGSTTFFAVQPGSDPPGGGFRRVRDTRRDGGCRTGRTHRDDFGRYERELQRVDRRELRRHGAGEWRHADGDTKFDAHRELAAATTGS
ncbi:MAG: hypothetical protein HC872_08710 [Gammaproteobacteria bacterium]|nr:hypothetical protein [Gammaproteobacteria bacterium]